ncbi:MAG: GNAT family N-acetyltransferase [Thermoclostridium sp.]|nr:GNAT family N-acetyltransferase [Thermoclostridium sp.]
MNASELSFTNTIEEHEYNFLRRSVGWPELSARQIAASLKNSAFFVAAKLGDRPIGITRVVSDGGYIAYIADVIVIPEFQRRGIGKTMVGMAMKYISDNLCEGETVFVNLMSAKDKEPFYKFFGFEERPNEKHGAGMTQYIKK